MVAPHIFRPAFGLARCVDIGEQTDEGDQEEWHDDRVDLVVRAA